MPNNCILCVEDDGDTQDMLKTMLELADFEAVLAPDVETALRLIEREKFSLYILDGGLQDSSSRSPCERIRSVDAGTPIIILSGHAFASDIEAGMNDGADAYLIKPDTSQLIPTIKRLLEKSPTSAPA